ncbi:MAG: AMP-binding protein [Firmicutes bacterium]|nr:AMP-binding protein [Bacillota bacterium]
MLAKSTAYNPDCKNIRELVYGAAERYPDRPAFRIKVKGEIQTVTFAEVIENTEALGTELLAQGFGGSSMGIIGDNSYPWYQCHLAIVCGGGISVPYDKGFTVEELESSIIRSKIRVLFYGHKSEGLVEEVRERGNINVEKFVRITGDGNEFDTMIEAGKEKIAAGNPLHEEYKNTVIDENALAVLLFTSGTTTTSKAVMLSQFNIAANTIDMYEYEAFSYEDVNMAFLPCHHSFGLGAVTVFFGIGGCSVFCDGLKYITKNLQEYGVTVFVGVPLLVENMYSKIMKEVEKKGMTKKVAFGRKLTKALLKVGIDVRRKVFAEILAQLGGKLRLIICGAAALKPEACEGMNDFGILTVQGYGMTETAPVLTAESVYNMRAGSVGKPMPRVQVKLDNVGEDGVGELMVKGPNVMLGYLEQPEATAEVLEEDGWLHTGDLAEIDKDGFVWIRGRSKSVIVMKNGKNIFPEEIESLVSGLEYVDNCMVFARDDKHNELVLWLKIVYSEAYLAQEGIDVNQLAERVKKDMAAINATMPTYKNINHFILDSEPMIMTTTQKVKRNLETKKINENRASELWFTV